MAIKLVSFELSSGFYVVPGRARKIYTMTYRYIGVISLSYTQKLLVYSFDGQSRWGGATITPHPSSRWYPL